MAPVTLENVTKVYPNGFQAVTDLSLDIEDGEFLVLVGPSGCGKSTALRMIAGLEEISGGELKIGERVVNDVEPKDRDIAMVFQNYALYPHMSVYDNIGFALKLAKTPKDEMTSASARPRASSNSRRTSSASRGSSPVASASASPWVGPSCASPRRSSWTSRCRTSTPSCASRCGPRSPACSATSGVTTFYVTHDQVEAMTMGDRVAVIKDGVLQQVDTPQNLYDKPDNVFVAAFIGSPSMNLFEGTFTLTGDGASVTVGSQTLSVPAEVLAARPALRNYDGQSLIYGVRPEDMDDAALDQRPDEQCLHSTVSLIEALGADILVHFPSDAPSVDSGDPDAVEDLSDTAMVVGRFNPRSTIRMGDEVKVAVNTSRMNFFDPTSRLAIWGA